LTSERSGAFFGRRKGKALRAGQKDLFATLLPRLRVDPQGDLSAESLFASPVRALWLEIGFGGGEHLLKEARANPDIGFIGCEPFVNGMAKLLAAIDRDNLTNIRLYDSDALDLLKQLPSAAFERVFLLYPDPWPKRRQRKRRFVSDETIGLIARILAEGGEFRFASDIDHYVGWTLAAAFRQPQFHWRAEKAEDWIKPWSGWESTRYEQKARREGRRSSYLTFERL
jgi:tRNA (guanine-N7-)-methyltransferase